MRASFSVTDSPARSCNCKHCITNQARCPPHQVQAKWVYTCAADGVHISIKRSLS
jgi:hypothetical protein